ncbi:MAG TPA: AmmeMemoRadiSam system protein B [Kineosporiaceae bacterium]|nr:AmmeMemoRadiSam system protein B [Kineosporiaceae bacterium]
MDTRPPTAAGRFYPDEAAELGSAVDRLLERAAATMHADAGNPPPWALVVPQAGYVFSGPIAASGYATLLGRCENVTRVVLLGPSPFVPLTGMATAAATRWSTPFGDVAVERAPGIPADDGPHAAEPLRWKCNCPSCRGCSPQDSRSCRWPSAGPPMAKWPTCSTRYERACQA